MKQYVSYVRARYGNCCVVFDGYKQGPSIEEHERSLCRYSTIAESSKKDSLHFLLGITQPSHSKEAHNQVAITNAVVVVVKVTEWTTLPTHFVFIVEV